MKTHATIAFKVNGQCLQSRGTYRENDINFHGTAIKRVGWIFMKNATFLDGTYK